MAYVPLHIEMYLATYTGAMGGLGASTRRPTDPIPTDPALVTVAVLADAWAQAFDTAFGAGAMDQLQLQGAEELSNAYWQSRSTPPNVAPFNTAANWAVDCVALVALLTAAETQWTAEGIVPPPVPPFPTEPSTFIFRPGAVTSGNVFATWAALIAATSIVQGPKTIEFDSSLGAVTIPAGAWAINPATDPSVIEFLGAQGTATTVTVLTGVSFTGTRPTLFRRLAILWQGAGATPCIDVTGTVNFSFRENSSVKNNTGAATAPFIRASAGGGVSLRFFDTSQVITSDASVSFLSTGAGSLMVANFYDNSAAPVGTTFAAAAGGTLSVLQGDNAQVTGDSTGNAATMPSTANKVFVFRPGGPTAPNVYITWAALFAAATDPNVRGPRTIEFDNSLAVLTIPAGAYNFGEWDVTFRGKPSTGTPKTPLTIADGATALGIEVFDTLDITCLTTATAFMTPPLAQTTSVIFRNTNVTQTGAGAFYRSTGAFSFQNALMFGSSTAVTGVGNAFESTGANAHMSIVLYDNAVIGDNTIGESGGGATLVFQKSPFAGASLVQAGMTTNPIVYGVALKYTAGDVTPGFQSAIPLNCALTDASSTVAPAPALQTTPGALTDILSAVVTPAARGRFRVQANAEFAATATDTVIATVTTRTKAAALVVANGTATGVNCFFAAANGPITFGAGLTTSTKITKQLILPAAPVTFDFDWGGVVTGGGAQGGFPVPTAANANNVAVSITVQDAANNVAIVSASLSVEEIQFG